MFIIIYYYKTYLIQQFATPQTRIIYFDIDQFFYFFCLSA